MTSSGMGVMGGAGADPTSMLNSQLASALSTMGDAQFWEETISPSTIRTDLQNSDPSNPSSTPVLQKCMKWLLASISKGRDVSDFYAHVVKLVGVHNLEVRKMVYMYLVQYADHDATTRELSLLSINAFQRGLADSEQLIRALALRVLSSIRIVDIIQIQILGVQKCAKDHSPYVRKCAANALAKLNPRCDDMQKEMLLEIMKNMLDHDVSTMVLTSALIAFSELCPDRLALLHSSYRKICHLLTDMDEWGQVVVLEILARYCRTFFKQPKAWKSGTAEKIDRSRRVRRTLRGFSAIATETDVGDGALNSPGTQNNTLPPRKTSPSKIKRRVVKKGFYSDEEDESTEEEVYAESPLGPSLSTASAMRERNILGLPGIPQIAINMDANEDDELDPDHRLLLESAMPLLKSRNAGVVLGVCSLLYYCGVASVKSRSAMGKALVRIHRNRREIQYVALTSIRALVSECPSAFAPFLNDFFVKALDPPFSRILKLDILTSLALEPAAIEAVLSELRSYVRHNDQVFACAAVQAVGKIVELSRVVYDRHGLKSGDMSKERRDANKIALDCLHGLTLASRAVNSEAVVGECVCMMLSILVLLSVDSSSIALTVEDPDDVRGLAVQRILVLLAASLESKVSEAHVEANEGGDDDSETQNALMSVATNIPESAVASSLWLAAELFSNPEKWCNKGRWENLRMSKLCLEIARLTDRAYCFFEATERLQAVHLASKLLALEQSSSAFSATLPSLCEHILAMSRLDTNTDVRDRGRFESAVRQSMLKVDRENLEGVQPQASKYSSALLVSRKAPSFFPVDDIEDTKRSFRFGTLSSLVGHKARGAYIALPAWAEKNSPAELRAPAEESPRNVPTDWKVSDTKTSAFYSNDSSSDSSSDSSDDESSSDSDESSSSPGADSENSSDSSSSASSSSVKQPGHPQNGPTNGFNPYEPGFPASKAASNVPVAYQSSSEDSSSGSESDTSSSDSSDDVSFGAVPSNKQDGTLLNMTTALRNGGTHSTVPKAETASSAIDDLRGLVIAPVVTDSQVPVSPDLDRDSSEWVQLVRPEHCNGLSVKGRYLRGPSKKREAALQSLSTDSPALVCLQIEFANRRNDSVSLRRIRILPRSGPSGSVGTKKVLAPPEISELKRNQRSVCVLFLEFLSLSDRDGDLVARLDIKSSTGGVPVEVKPSLAELLRPMVLNSSQAFDEGMRGLQGFQRVASTFAMSNQSASSIPLVIRKHTALVPVGPATTFDANSTLRYVGGLPLSEQAVYVLIEGTSSTQGKITVCCDSAMVVSNILNQLSKAIASI